MKMFTQLRKPFQKIVSDSMHMNAPAEIVQVVGQQQSPLEIIVIKDGKELKLGMDINVNLKWVVETSLLLKFPFSLVTKKELHWALLCQGRQHWPFCDQPKEREIGCLQGNTSLLEHKVVLEDLKTLLCIFPRWLYATPRAAMKGTSMSTSWVKTLFRISIIHCSFHPDKPTPPLTFYYFLGNKKYR